MEMEENHVLCYTAADLTPNIVGASLKGDRMYGRSKSGETVLVEIVSAPEDDEKQKMNKRIEPEFNTNGTNEVIDRQAVRSELQNIAKEFPSCAKYLLKELDKRRYVSTSGIVYLCTVGMHCSYCMILV